MFWHGVVSRPTGCTLSCLLLAQSKVHLSQRETGWRQGYGEKSGWMSFDMMCLFSESGKSQVFLRLHLRQKTDRGRSCSNISWRRNLRNVSIYIYAENIYTE